MMGPKCADQVKRVSFDSVIMNIKNGDADDRLGEGTPIFAE
jgi:hypothetical protein